MLDEVIRTVTSRAGVVRVRTALNPLLWTSAIVPPTCWAGAYAFYADPVLRYGLAALGAIPILVAIAAYVYFMLKDPDRLQSEEFVIRQRQLAITERKGRPKITSDEIAIDESRAREEH